MAHMEVILTQDQKKLGKIGDKVRVKNGYARNFLLPRGKALRATKDNVAYFESKRADIEKRDQEAKKEAEATFKKLDGTVVTVIRKASDDGRLYGSVAARDIAAELKNKGHDVERRTLDLGVVIKEIGIYPVNVELHPAVIAKIKVNVARSESEAEAALKAGEPVKKEAVPAADPLAAVEVKDALESEAEEADEADTAEASADAANEDKNA